MSGEKPDKQLKSMLQQEEADKKTIQKQPKTITFNTGISFYDNNSGLFLVNISETIIPLNTLISLIISCKGKFTSLGLSYNPEIGKEYQELAYMYEVLSDLNFSEALTKIIESYDSRKNEIIQSN